MGRWARAALAAWVALAGPAGNGTACMPIGDRGKPVTIDDETAIIVWDKASRTQHFIRRARFNLASSQTVGFLVPTPSPATLHELDQAAFDALPDITKPEIVVRRVRMQRPRPRSDFTMVDAMLPRAALKSAARPEGPPPVRVLERRRIGDMEAAVLAATDPAALEAWLGKHGFPAGPRVRDWLGPYIAQKWSVVAFRFPEGKEATRFVSQGVRLTFRTDRPVYPYREPPPEAGEQVAGAVPERMLRVFLLASERMAGKLGDADWAAAVHAKPLPEAQRDRLAKLGVPLPAAKEGAAVWLTELEDRTLVRATGKDVDFVPAADQSPLARPPIERIEYDYYDPPAPNPWPATAYLGLTAAFLLGTVGLLRRLGAPPR